MDNTEPSLFTQEGVETMYSRSKIGLNPCACGCGTKIMKGLTTRGRVREYVRGHNRRGARQSLVSRKMMSRAKLGYKMSRDTKNKISKANRGQTKWNKGKSFVKTYGKVRAKQLKRKFSRSQTGKKFTLQHRRNMSEARLNYLAKGTSKLCNTSIEKRMQRELKRRNIPFRTQVKIGSFVVDLKIKGVPIAIECDGDYWHSLDNVQRKDIIRNKAVPKVLGKHGRLLIFLGSEINNDIRRCGRIVKRHYKEFRS